MTHKFGDIATDGNSDAWMVTAVHADSLTVMQMTGGWTTAAFWDENANCYFLGLTPQRLKDDTLKFTDNNVNDVLANINIGQDAVKPPLPQRIPGQSLADAYAAKQLAEQEETALKAHRLNEVHEWLIAQYEAAVEAVQLYKMRVYSEVLYLIETGKNPQDNLEELAQFEQDRYGVAWSKAEHSMKGIAP